MLLKLIFAIGLGKFAGNNNCSSSQKFKGFRTEVF